MTFLDSEMFIIKLLCLSPKKKIHFRSNFEKFGDPERTCSKNTFK